MKYVLVFSTVLMNVASALILNFASKQSGSFFQSLVISLIALAIIINGLRFALWGYIHNSYELSKTYPITSLFFPLIFLISYIQENVEISIGKISGLFLIVIGVIINEKK